MIKVKEVKPGPNIVSYYNCGKCNKLIQDYRLEELKIEKYKYCPYCGEELDWGDN